MIYTEKMARACRQSPRRLFFLPAAILGLLAIASGLWSCQDSRKTYDGKPITLTIGTPALETNALIYVAEDKGYFTRNGIHVTLKDYDSGGAAVPGLMRKEVDLAIASEFVMVLNLLGQSEIRFIASIDRFENMFLIARKDRNIEKVTDLKRRKIGVPAGTIGSFYLGRYFALHGLGTADTMFKDVRPDRAADALDAGDIDAVVTWHPFVDTIKGRYGERVVLWPIQTSQLTYWNIAARPEWIGANRGAIERLLRSLSQAEEYALLHPKEAMAAVKKRLGYSDDHISKVWGDNQFSLSLDHSLVAAMEDEARWMIANNLATAKQIPDFLEHIYADGLRAVKPQAIKIIR